MKNARMSLVILSLCALGTLHACDWTGERGEGKGIKQDLIRPMSPQFKSSSFSASDFLFCAGLRSFVSGLSFLRCPLQPRYLPMEQQSSTEDDLRGFQSKKQPKKMSSSCM
jgi:hypothetical protein